MHAMPRQNLKHLTAAARRRLNDKIRAYIDSPADPVAVHERHFDDAHGPVRFILWHRNFLKGFDDWQRIEALENDDEFVPLAYWDPGDPIPAELPHNGRKSNIPRFPLPEIFAGRQSLAELTDVVEFARELEVAYHNGIHTAIGGVMAGERSPEDPIFWPLHAFFDYIAANWETIHGDVVDGAAGV